MKKYVLHPGYVFSRIDNDKHYISSDKLKKLYNVDQAECVEFIPLRPYPDQDKMIHLYPRYDGNYSDMGKKQQIKDDDK